MKGENIMSKDEFAEWLSSNCVSADTFYNSIREDWNSFTTEQQMYLAIEGLGFLDDNQVDNLKQMAETHFEIDTIF